MEFSLLHAGLAAGAALAAIPVILHLILRQQPERLLFPALRLVRLRHRVTVRRLRLRHLLLLLLRMLAIALMALALARPSIHGASFVPDQQAPVSAALIFDTSMSMEYRERDVTRLAAAKAAALDWIRELPEGSELLVFDVAEPAAYSTLGPGAALQRVKALRLRPIAGPVNEALLHACQALSKAAHPRREIVLYSDLTEGSIKREGAAAVQAALERVPGGLGLYLFRVGVSEPDNAAIARVEQTGSVIPANSDWRVELLVRNRGDERECTVELWLDGQRRGSRPVRLPEDGVARTELTIRALAPGLHQGMLTLSNGGKLDFDDTYYLTIEVGEVLPVLIVTDVPDEAVPFRDAIAPPLLIQQHRSRCRCVLADTAELAGIDLARYRVVFLVNVSSLSDQAWQKLESFARSGGGLGHICGYLTNPGNFNQSVPLSLFGVRLTELITLAEPIRLRPLDTTHPVVVKLHQWAPEAIGQIIVERYLRCEVASEQVQTVLGFSDGSPALLVRQLGGRQAGRTLVLATAVGPGRPGEPWNDLPQRSVQFVMLADGMVRFLARQSDQRLNFFAGDDVVLRFPINRGITSCLIESPDPNTPPTRRAVDPNEATVVIATPEVLGNYRVVATGEGKEFVKGFSLNTRRIESRLQPLSEGDLNALFGKDNYAVASSNEELQEAMGDVRIGRELFPWLMILILLLLLIEHLVANRFYRQASSAGTEARQVRAGRAAA